MQRILFFAVFFVCTVLGVSAKNAYYVSSVDSVAKVGKTFVAYGYGGSTTITAAEYLKIKKSPTDFFIIEYNRENGFTLVVDRSQFTNKTYLVDSVGVAADGKIQVFLNNGKEPYTTKKAEWAKVIKGQAVHHLVINSPKREFEIWVASEPKASFGIVNSMRTGQKLFAACQQQETETVAQQPAAPVVKKAATAAPAPKKTHTQGKLIFK